MTRKLCVVVTARPSYALVRTVLQALANRPDVELQLVIAGSALLDRFGSVKEVVAEDGFEVAAEVYNLVEGGSPMTMAKSAGLGVVEMAPVLSHLRPDAVVVIADRFEIIAASLASAYMNIPLVHLQGGEVTGSIDEKVRHSVTKLADLHLVSTELAGKRVVRMGEEPSAVHVTGCPSIDIARLVAADPALPADLLDRYGSVGDELDLNDDFVVVLQHPVTTEYGQARSQVTETLHALAELDTQVMWFWPNPDAGTDGTSEGIRAFRELHRSATRGFRFFKNLRPDDFLRVLLASRGIVGNSSVAVRECSYLGVPAVNIGSRQSGRERGRNVVDVDHDRSAIRVALEKQLGHGRHESDSLYGDGRAGERIASILATAELTSEKRLAY